MTTASLTSPAHRRLGRTFFSAPTLTVARALLGKRLVRIAGGRRTVGVIVETEAYIGEDDLACHAAAGRTTRNAVMYGAPGHAYVYFVYGMHHCLNIVTESPGHPAAVLIRALVPAEGIGLIAERRGLAERLRTELQRPAGAGKGPGPALRSLLNGPGKLCAGLAIDRELNGESLLGSRLFLEQGRLRGRIHATPRIGVDYAGDWREKPWRFLIDSPWVSARPRA
jgi:DNA-3-methyladenine glycosylase